RKTPFTNCRIAGSAIHIAGNAPGRGGPLFDSSPPASGENNHRRPGRVINREGKKKFAFDVDLLFHQDGLDRELPYFHRQHARRVGANIVWLAEGHATNACSPSRPSLNLDDHFNAEFFRRGHSVISGRSCAPTRNLKSVGGENGFALILVKSCHG